HGAAGHLCAARPLLRHSVADDLLGWRCLGGDFTERRRAGRHGGGVAVSDSEGGLEEIGVRQTMLDVHFCTLALTRKELLAILKDPRSRFSLFIPPILQCLIYGYVATYDLTDVPYAVLDQDRSAASVELLAELDGSGIFRRVANLTRAADIK